MSPSKFRAFTDVLFSESGVENVSEMISAKAAQLKETDAYKGLDENALNDIAYSEVTAEMMETALTDTDVLSRISSRLQQTDKSLWGKIKDFLKGLVDRLKAAYQEMNPDSSIARLARQSIQSSENALNAFADAASDAIVNYNLQDGGTVSAESAVNTASTVNTASSAVNTVESITKAEGGVDTASSAANTTESIARAESTAEVQKNAAQENAEQSVKRTEYGEFVAAVSDDILKNTDPARWSGVDKEHAIIAAKEALAKFGEIVVYDITDEQFGNICQVSTEQMRSGKLLPLTSSNYKAVAIGNVLMGAGKNQYSVSVYVGKTQTGDNVFCGVRDIKPTQFTVTEGRRRAAATEISGKLQDGQKNSAQEGVRYSLRGTNKNGIEVYETSDEVKALSWKERKAQYLDIMRNEYAGRTAKFTRNGHDYYAQFDSSSLRKPIYGDNRSTQKGVRALANAGADGDFFTLVENSQYRGSKPNGKDHTGADYFDYFVKTVQIDGNVFDLVADVERNYYVKGGYIYTLALRDNKKMGASPAHSIQDAGKGAGNASYVGTISQQDADVKQNMRYSSRQSQEVKQALDDYRYQRDVEFKAMKAVYDAERSQIEQAYRMEMQTLEDSYRGDTATMSREFVRLLREYDKQGLSREKLEQKLLDAKKDNATWEREFKRLLREYDGDIDRLEGKLKKQQKDAKAKVENARKIEERQKLERVISDINRRLLSPTKTLYVPDSLQPAVTTAMQSIATIQQQGAAETARRVTERYEELLAKLRKNPTKNAAAIEETEARLANILARQKATVQNALERMQDAYAELTRVNQGVFTQEYNEGIMGFIQDAKDAIGDTSYGDLSIKQLQTVRDAYTSILIKNQKIFQYGKIKLQQKVRIVTCFC